MKKVLEKDPPYGSSVTFKIGDPADGWAAPIMDKWLEDSVQTASKTYFKKPAAFTGEGGSIPFMAMLGEQFPKAQFVITGVLGPMSNAHGPNEFLHLEMVERVTCCMSKIIHDFYVSKN
jgi:acetylornithine deacetylase/succinyl-diaminopimelate desuccinylase-like protein